MCNDYCEGIACRDYDLCDQSRWHPVDNGLPYPQYHGQHVTCGVLVTVEPINKDSLDDSEVTIAMFNCDTLKFHYYITKSYVYGTPVSGMKVIAWQYMPVAYKKYNNLG